MSPLLNLGTFILHFDEVIPAVAANLVVVCEPLDKKAVWSANFPYNATVMLFAIECTPTNQVTFIQFSHLQPRSCATSLGLPRLSCLHLDHLAKAPLRTGFRAEGSHRSQALWVWRQSGSEPSHLSLDHPPSTSILIRSSR